MFFRGLFTFVPILIIVAVRAGGIRQLVSRNIKGTGIRAVFGAGTSIFVVLSLVYLPLADALAIIFLYPIMLTALSLPMLGERVGWRRWLAVFVGFAGLLLMVKTRRRGHPVFLRLSPVHRAAGGAAGRRRRAGCAATTVPSQSCSIRWWRGCLSARLACRRSASTGRAWRNGGCSPSPASSAPCRTC